jgi:hypothetical protein
MLGVCFRNSDSSRSEHYFARARTGFWSESAESGLAALSVSDHFANWHYLNYHQLITEGFRDAGRQRGVAGREVIVIHEGGPSLQRCVSDAQKLLAEISGWAFASSFCVFQAPDF